VLTRQGWSALWGGAALLVVGRFFGIAELYVFGAAALLLVVAALAYVHLIRLDLEVNRRVFPSRVHAGSTSRVEIRVRNLRGSPTALLRLHEQVTGTAGADMLLPPVEVNSEAATSYRLPTTRRGILKVGPLRIIVSDPFGLAQSSVVAADQVDVTVFPRVDLVQPVPFTVGHDPLAGALQAHALSNSGDDFYALRPYVMGDDLRHIHWPSTARHDELLIRQSEQPWQGRTTVLVDVNSRAHTPDGLEVAISAAASVCSANMKRNDLVRLVTTDGRDSGFGTGRTHLEGMLEHLALVTASPQASLRSTAGLLQHSKGSGGALVVIAGSLPDQRGAALALLARRVGLLLVVEVGGGEPSNGAQGGRPDGQGATNGAGGLPRLRLTGTMLFPPAWQSFLTRRSNGPNPTVAARTGKG
jgi:uncharacterized protein (DUF58 family)